jgi:hypothetical protein
LTIGYLRVASVEIIRRWASRPATNAISVIQLSHTSPINTLRLHQILDSSLYLSVSATRETWDQIRRVYFIAELRAS